jgi:hypoxanthine phosphoribosyltransferase
MLNSLSPGLITGEDVLLIEDMVDTGASSAKAFEVLQNHHPKSLKLCTLLDKPECRKVPITIDYLGLTIPDKFIVGYGIDFDEKYRQLPDIYTLEAMNER